MKTGSLDPDCIKTIDIDEEKEKEKPKKQKYKSLDRKDKS